ncbi:MAG TPA: aminopeptidase P family protein [Methanomicrobia archaeon]|nr:aminopeptidase P family protein [Methanomicrobia archaeon]
MARESAHRDEVQKPLLMLSESLRNADMYYATRFLAGDPFIYLAVPQGQDQKELLVVSQMEYERARKESRVHDVRSSLDYGTNLKWDEVLIKLLRDEGVTAAAVPRTFYLGTAETLRTNGIDVVPQEEIPITKQREIKTDQEVQYIIKAQQACEFALAQALAIIKQARVGKDRVLWYNGAVLTAERVRAIIEHALIDAGCSSNGDLPIVSCGKQASDPHYSGRGPLLPDEPIIIDIFPRLKTERYFADMTRTVVYGEPDPEIRAMYDAVLAAQNAALARVTAGVSCRDVHFTVCELFEARGYGTIRTGAKRGFIHSTGHGVGLNVHENPSVSDNEYVLQQGNVIAIEPGLYEPDVGGVRLEDLVLVHESGCRNLTTFAKQLVL